MSLKVFGCIAFVHIPPYQRNKLDPKSIKYLFLRYSSKKKGYKCYSPTTWKFYNTIDVTFFQNQPFYSKTHIQMENSTFSKEYQFWQDIDISSSRLFIISNSITLSVTTTSPIPIIPILLESPSKSDHSEPIPSSPQVPTQQEK